MNISNYNRIALYYATTTGDTGLSYSYLI